MDELRDYSLPEDLAVIADAYDATVGDRDRFIWEWFHRLDLYGSEPRRAESTGREPILVLYVTLLDDLIDRITFREAAELLFDRSDANLTGRASTSAVCRWPSKSERNSNGRSGRHPSSAGSTTRSSSTSGRR